MIPFTLGSFLIFCLICFRILGCFMLLPFFMSGTATIMKAALAIAISFLIFPSAALGVEAPALNIIYLVLTAQEVLTGLLIGFVVRLSFNVITVMGELASQEMGFRMSQQMDPITGNNTPTITQFYQFVAFWLFFTLNGHYWILEILSRSFEAVPLGFCNITVGFGEWFASLYTKLFSLGIQLASPIFLLMLMITVGIGMLAKLVEGINVFDIGFPIRICVGLLFLMLFLPYLKTNFYLIFESVNRNMIDLLRVI
jgi:flagellar biosynthetic protein FliR